jgi:hypothetical protein
MAVIGRTTSVLQSGRRKCDRSRSRGGHSAATLVRWPPVVVLLRQRGGVWILPLRSGAALHQLCYAEPRPLRSISTLSISPSADAKSTTRTKSTSRRLPIGQRTYSLQNSAYCRTSSILHNQWAVSRSAVAIFSPAGFYRFLRISIHAHVYIFH